MKRLFIGIVLPLLCIISLIGSAFATWYFDNNLTSSASSTLGVTISKYAQVGSLELKPITGELKLTLDQPSKTSPGISLNNDLTAIYRPASASNDPTSPEYNYAQNLKFIIKVEVTIPKSLARYISMKENTSLITEPLMNGYTSSVNAKGDVVYVKEFKPTKLEQVSLTNDLSVYKTDFIYTNNIPKSLAEYKEMYNTVLYENEKINIKFITSLTGEHFTQ